MHLFDAEPGAAPFQKKKIGISSTLIYTIQEYRII
jgi:hypothetical protein